MLYHTLHLSIFYTHSIWQVTLHTMLYESIVHLKGKEKGKGKKKRKETGKG